MLLFQMSKITVSTKYLDKRHMIMGIIGSVCVVLILAFQFTNIDTQNVLGFWNIQKCQNNSLSSWEIRNSELVSLLTIESTLGICANIFLVSPVHVILSYFIT